MKITNMQIRVLALQREGLTQAEIAERLNVSEKAIHQRIARAKQALRAMNLPVPSLRLKPQVLLSA